MGEDVPVAAAAAASRTPEPGVAVSAGRSGSAHGTDVEAEIAVRERQHRVSYRFPEGPIAPGGDAWLAAALPIAMACGASLRIPGPVSSRVWRALPAIQRTYAEWNPDWRVVSVTVDETRSPAGPASTGGADRSAAFFSGGVDSFFTLLSHESELDALIFVRGFDLPVDDEETWRHVSGPLRDAAAHFGKRLIEVATNLREVSDRYVPWEMYHGAAIASVLLLLAPRWSRAFIPASDTYGTLVPWGSHPHLDPLWSTEATEVVHDGCEVSRVAKVVRIAECDAALRALRVCWERPRTYNCGACEKCLRTMAALRVARALDRCPTFARPLNLRALARMSIPHSRGEVTGMLEAAEAAGTDAALIRALRDCLSGHPRRGIWSLAGQLQRRVRTALQGRPDPRPR